MLRRKCAFRRKSEKLSRERLLAKVSRRQFNNFPYASPRPCPASFLRPLTSIVLPVYNHAEFVEHSINSVLAASEYPLELIVVDDGSTDETPNVLKNFAQNSQVVLIRQENAGIAAALNKGFSVAKGSLWGWTSADNLYLASALDYLIDYLLLNPSLSLAYGNVQLIDEFGEALKDSSYRTQDQSPLDSSILQLPLQGDSLLRFNDNFVNACFLYRADLARKVGLYSSEYLGYEDYDYWMRLAVLAPIAHLDLEDPIYQYRLHRNSLTAQLETDSLSEAQNKLRLRYLSRQSVLEAPQGITCALTTQPVTPEWNAILHSALFSAGVTVQDAPSSLKLSLEVVQDSKEEAPTDFKHCTHQHFAKPLPPLELLPDELLGQTRENSTVYLPPVDIPLFFKRARDSNYGAVSKSQGCLASLLCFTPELDAEKETFFAHCQSLLSECPLITLAFLCTNNAQRAIADSFYLQSEENSRFRIVDCSEQEGSALQQSLLFLLSSVDAVLSTELFENFSWQALLEFRVEASLAASAGIPLLSFMTPETYQSQEFCRAQGLTPMPHLLLVDGTKIATEKTYALIQDNFEEDSPALSLASLDQWLSLQSSKALGRSLKFELLRTAESELL